MFFSLITKESRINTNLFVLQCVSFCRVLDLSCSLCPSINSVSADFTSNWYSSSLVDWWEYSSIYCWTAVGGASLKVWLLWEELHWRRSRSAKVWVCFSTNSHIKHLCLPAINCIYVSVTITNSWFLSLYPHSKMALSMAAVLRAPRKLCSFSYVLFVFLLLFYVLDVVSITVYDRHTL